MATRTYTYNANKKVTKIITNLGITSTAIFTYNTKGLIIQVHGALEDINYTYSYDKKGNWVTQNRVMNDGKVEIWKREYTYY